jgi:hypothetical protein
LFWKGTDEVYTPAALLKIDCKARKALLYKMKKLGIGEKKYTAGHESLGVQAE